MEGVINDWRARLTIDLFLLTVEYMRYDSSGDKQGAPDNRLIQNMKIRSSCVVFARMDKDNEDYFLLLNEEGANLKKGNQLIHHSLHGLKNLKKLLISWSCSVSYVFISHGSIIDEVSQVICQQKFWWVGSLSFVPFGKFPHLHAYIHYRNQLSKQLCILVKNNACL